MGLCGEDDKARARAGGEVAAHVLRAGPPVPQGPDASLRAARRVVGRRAGPPAEPTSPATSRARAAPEGAPAVDLSGGSGQIAAALWNQIDADTLVERGVLVAGDPESCLEASRIHEEAGVDELQFLMATESVPHDEGHDVDRALRQARHPRAEEEDRSRSPMIRAKPEVEAMTPYVAPLEGRRSLLRLDFNESTVGPSRRSWTRFAACRPTPTARIRSTQGSTRRTRRRSACRRATSRPSTASTPRSGRSSTPTASAAARSSTTVPTFGYYAPCAQQQGMVIDEIPYLEDLRFPLEAVARRLEVRPRLVFICNPNNPTGTLVAPHAIVALARSSPQTLVVVDELYVAFTGQSVLPAALELPNVVVLHSLSKAAGIAALRLGFAVGPSDDRRAAPPRHGPLRHQHVRGRRREGGPVRREPHAAVRRRGARDEGVDDRRASPARRSLRR